MSSDTSVLVEAEILRCAANINLSVKNWGEIKEDRPGIDDVVVVTALTAHALSMGEHDAYPSAEFLAVHLAVAIKMLYEERNRQ